MPAQSPGLRPLPPLTTAKREAAAPTEIPQAPGLRPHYFPPRAIRAAGKREPDAVIEIPHVPGLMPRYFSPGSITSGGRSTSAVPAEAVVEIPQPPGLRPRYFSPGPPPSQIAPGLGPRRTRSVSIRSQGWRTS